jgi:diguanylate cyclase (GGDEF)-like protein
LSTRVTFRAGLVWAMGLFLAVYAVRLAVHGDGLTNVDNGLGLLAVWASAGVCWLAVSRVGLRRWEVLFPAAAVTSFAAGLTYYAVAVAGGGSMPFPSPTDLINLLFYPLMLAALAVAVRRHVRGLAVSVWLDSAVGSLGAVAVLAVVLRPVLDSARAGSQSLATMVAVAPPMFDLVLVATVAGIAALGGKRMGNRWGLLAVGLMVFAAADVVYALQVTADTYVAGTPLDAGWAIGLALVAMWVDGAERRDGPTTRPQTSATTRPTTAATALVVPVVATAAALGVLVAGTQAPLSKLAVALAAVTLLAAATRTQVAFRQLAHMADLQRVAALDPLTGVYNRRFGLHRLTEEFGRSIRSSDPLGVLMLDLDHFKAVNDTYGHLVGDRVLQAVVRATQQILREGDVLLRYGGEEFIIVLPGAGRDDLVKMAERVRRAVAEAEITEAGQRIPVTVSIGGSGLPNKNATNPQELIGVADVALYTSKETGRDRCVIA